MKRILMCIVLILLVGTSADFASATVYYVSKTGNDKNTGKNWENSFLTINKAVSSAVSGDYIWVAKGKYVEGKAIEIASGINAFGGFYGTETSPEERSTTPSLTIIDGDAKYRCVKNFGFIDGFNITNGSATHGGGIWNEGQVKNCLLYANKSTKYLGGGIFNRSGTVENCRIYSNTAAGLNAYGGGIYNAYESKITNCLIFDNSSEIEGGGIYNAGGEILNCTIYRNSCYKSGGVYNVDGKIKNSIVWRNSNSDIHGIAGVSYSCFSEADGTNGNIRANPLFQKTSPCVSSWELNLQNTSPCVDSGTSAGAPPSGYEGNPRPGTDGKVCMGAYESPDNYQNGGIAAPLVYYVSQSGNNTTGLTWEDSFTSITKATEEVISDDLYEIRIAEGIYAEGKTIRNPEQCRIIGGYTSGSVKKSFGGKTIIDGNNAYSCMQNYGIIEDLYITNGKALDSGYKGYSGGVFNSGRITNCVIYGNSAFSGGGIYNYFGTVTFTTVYGNSSSDFASGICNIDKGIVKNSISWGNSQSDIYGRSNVYNSCFGEADETNGNIRGNPLFVNTSTNKSTWDLHLQNNSACVDSADIIQSPYFDIEGNERPGSDMKVTMGAYECPDNYINGAVPVANRFYVYKNGNNTTGASWSQAFVTLAKALEHCIGDNIYEIWIAGDRFGNTTYQESNLKIPSRCHLAGGFRGQETNFDERDFDIYKTVIRGSGYSADSAGILDGLSFDGGGGIINSGTILNDKLYSTSSYSIFSGGIQNYGGLISNSEIYSNTVSSGAAIGNYSGIVSGCRIYSNDSGTNSGLYSGAIYNEYGLVINSEIYGNSSSNSTGGINNCGGTVINSSIYNNSSGSWSMESGGLENAGTAVNCLIYGNYSYGYSGGVNNSGTLINCTVYGNTSGSTNNPVGGIENKKYRTIINTISWGNSGADILNSGNVYNSCYKESTGANNSKNSNPLFVNVSGSHTTWNFHLQDSSPCIDQGQYSAQAFTDIEGTPRPQGITWDMGAFESRKTMPDNSQFISSTCPVSMAADTDYQIEIIMKNSGINSWSNAGGYTLRIMPVAEFTWGVSEIPIQPGITVAENESTTFTLTIHSPSVPGAYPFQCSMKNPENTFGEMTKIIYVEVYGSGDISQDGMIDQMDALYIKYYLLHQTEFDSMQILLSDINKDGIIDISDVVTLTNIRERK